MDEIKELVTQMIYFYITEEFHDDNLAEKAKEYIEKERMTFVTEQFINDYGVAEGGHYSGIHGIVLREKADKTKLSLIGLVIHEIQHMFSDKISGNKEIVTEQLDEGFSDLFAELVINNYRENHKEEYKKAFPNSDYEYENASLYFSENNCVRMILETIRINSGKDNQAIKEYIFGDKNEFIKICEENIGKEFKQILKLQRKGGLYDQYNYEANEKLIELIANLNIDYVEESNGLNARLFSQRNDILADLKKVSKIKQKLKEKKIDFNEIGLQELPIVKEICEKESVDGIGKSAVTLLIYKPIYRKILSKNSIKDFLKIKDIYGYFPAKDVAWDLVKDSDIISKEDKVKFLEETSIYLKTNNSVITSLLNQNTINKPIIQELLSEYLNKMWSKDDIDNRKKVLEKIKEYKGFVSDTKTTEGEEYKKAVQKILKRYNTTINELKGSRFATEDLKNMLDAERLEEIDLDIRLKGDDPMRLIFLQDNYRDVNIINKENVKSMTMVFIEDIQSKGGNTNNIVSQLFSQHNSYRGTEKYNKLMIECLQEIYSEKEVNNIFRRKDICEFIELLTENRIRFDSNDIENSKICLELKEKALGMLEKLSEVEFVKEKADDIEEYNNEDIHIRQEGLQSVNVDKIVEVNEILEEILEDNDKKESTTELQQPIDYEQLQQEEITQSEKGTDSKVEEDIKKEELHVINSKETTVSKWMSRFNSWYNAIDKVSKKAKSKFVEMKADIVKVISDRLKSKSKAKDAQEVEK